MLHKGILLSLLAVAMQVSAQPADTTVAAVAVAIADSVVQMKDTVGAAEGSGVAVDENAVLMPEDSFIVAEELFSSEEDNLLATSNDSVARRVKRDWTTWRPNAKRALWLSLVLPGAGQIYNRKYWKIPIVYGGFVGCIYAMRWNNQMYHDYSQAYLDIMDDDPSTESYNQFLHLGATINDSNLTRYQTLFKNRKDKYRRWRDLSFFCLVGVYALSVIDAYVDASLSEFDISKDLSMRVEPTIMDGNMNSSPLRAKSLGVSCSLSF